MLMGLGDETDIKKQRDKVTVLGDLPQLGRPYKSGSTSRSKNHILIFVTPTLIDPAGNRVHREDYDLPAVK